MIEAYPVENGTFGIRRWRLALPSVVCSTQAARRAVESVEYGKTVEHPLGCAQVGSDKEQTFNTLVGIGAHPNVSRTVVVGLGCEGVPAQEIAEGIRRRGRAAEAILIQAQGGMKATIGQVERTLTESGSEARDRVGIEFHHLTVGLAHFQAMGPSGQRLAEALRAAGARLIWSVEESQRGPGRFLRYAEPLPDDAVQGWMLAQGGEAASLTSLVAAGCHMVLSVGDLHHLGGHPIAPVVRLGVDPQMKAILSDDVDGWIEDRSTEAWMAYVEAVANGQTTVSEELGGDLFAIARLGPTL